MTRAFRTVFVVVWAGAMVWQLGGCGPLTQGSSIQTGIQTVMTEVVGPAVQKAGAELATRTAHLSGQVSAINPGYKVTGYAIFGTGAVYDLNVNAVGLSANVAGASQADQGDGAVIPPERGP